MGERVCVGDEVFEDNIFQGMAQSEVAATGRPTKVPPEADLKAMLAENWEDPRAKQFLNMGHRFMLEGNGVDALELLGQRSQASELGECSN